jgi:predicted nuclease of predicted toxin-antitoxin system
VAVAAAARVWVDAQLPPALARWLALEHGVAATHVQDVGLLVAPDEAIFEAARAAGVAIVVTKDEDFVPPLDRRGPPPQVVWITCGNVRNAELRRIVQAAWLRVAELLAAGEPLVEIHQRA